SALVLPTEAQLRQCTSRGESGPPAVWDPTIARRERLAWTKATAVATYATSLHSILLGSSLRDMSDRTTVDPKPPRMGKAIPDEIPYRRASSKKRRASPS